MDAVELLDASADDPFDAEFMEKLLKKSEGRKKFLSWLFKLADMRHTGQVLKMT